MIPKINNCVGAYIFWTAVFIIFVAIRVHSLTDSETRLAAGTLRKACTVRGVLPSPPSRVNTTLKLAALRKAMRTPSELRSTKVLDAVLITSDDEHQTEFVSNYDRRLEYVSGFDGISGEGIITHHAAALWVDGRYHIQANDQLDCNWLLMQEGLRHVPTKAEWLNKTFPSGAVIGADPKLMSGDAWNSFEYDLELQNSKLKLIKTNVNVVDSIWVNHSEAEQEKQAFTLDDTFTGKKWTEKVIETRKELRKLNVEAMVVTALDEIAWLLNIRGRDIPYTRFVKSYVLLSQTEIILYVDQHKTKNNVTKFFNAEVPGLTISTVKIKDYDTFWSDLVTYCQVWKTVLVPSACVYSPGASKAVYDLIPEGQRISKQSPIIFLKAKKNPTEILGMRNAHIRDGAAMCKFLQYFESRFDLGDPWNELKVATEIDRFRMEQDLAVNVSFKTIVAFGAHGAQPHYEPSVATSQPITDESTLIIDSGGQYCDGTTDVSRTIHLGIPTEAQKDAYTRVLIGSIQLTTLTFPESLKPSSIDVLARAPLWEIGEDYPHATGHGVGAFLGVHESPIFIHYNPRIRQDHFKPGYFFSNEPGIYLEDKFGIRLENVLEVIEKPHIRHHYGHVYLGFQDVTLVPYCNKLFKYDLLGVQHRRWLNDYNARIRKLVGAELKRQNATDAFYWMMENTKHIPEQGRSGMLTSHLYLISSSILLLKITL